MEPRPFLFFVFFQAWIVNASLKDNITFGTDVGAAVDADVTYRQVLDACALTSDLLVLPQGDQTPIGDKGMCSSCKRVLPPHLDIREYT